MAFKILVVDDERAIAEILKYNLEKEQYEVILAFDGEDALEKVRSSSPDLVILDIMLPGKDGFQVCREIRSQSRLPIIMLTAKESEIDKVVGLEMGADDYITKPFGTQEFLARVKAVLRRTAPQDSFLQERLVFGEIEIDLNLRDVYKQGEAIDLTFREFSLLYYLARNQGHVFSREKLLNDVWGYSFAGEERTVDVTIRRLREKIENNPADPEYICTKRGVGYYFRRKEDV